MKVQARLIACFAHRRRCWRILVVLPAQARGRPADTSRKRRGAPGQPRLQGRRPHRKAQCRRGRRGQPRPDARLAGEDLLHRRTRANPRAAGPDGGELRQAPHRQPPRGDRAGQGARRRARGHADQRARHSAKSEDASKFPCRLAKSAGRRPVLGAAGGRAAQFRPRGSALVRGRLPQGGHRARKGPAR